MKAGLPRRFMGRSMFSYDQILRYVARVGLQPLHYIELDIGNAHFQLVLSGLSDEERSEVPLTVEYEANRPSFIEEARIATKSEAGTCKTLFISLGMCQSFERWRRSQKIEFVPQAFADKMMLFGKEQIRIANFYKKKMPDEFAKVQAYAKKIGKSVNGCWLRRVANRFERDVINAVEATGIDYFDYQHDGLGLLSDNDDVLLAKAQSSTEINLVIKTPPDEQGILTLAKQKFPLLDWEPVCTSLPSLIFFNKLLQCDAALHGKLGKDAPARSRGISGVFSEIIASTLEGSTLKRRGTSDLERFDYSQRCNYVI